MRLLDLVKPVAFMLLSGAFASLPVLAAAPEYPLSKFRLCQPCTMPIIPVALPRQGMVLSYGSIQSDGSLWYLVDLERAEATRFFARMDRVTRKLSVVEQVTHPLLPSELSELTQLANRIWTSKDALPTQMATDVVWDLWLLDGDDVRRDFGAGVPDGLAKEVEQIMQRLVGPEVPVRHGAS